MKTRLTCRTMGDIGQWLSVFIMGIGVYLCYSYRVDAGTILFSIGALVETLSTKIKYYGERYIERNKDILIIAKEKASINLYTEEQTVVDGQGYLDFHKGE